MLASFTDSPTEIANRLNDEKYAEKYGFTTIVVNRKCVSQRVVKLRGSDEVLQQQVAYLADFSAVPLAYKKQRVLELVALFDSIENMTTEAGKPLSDVRQFHLKRAVLSDIKDEIGEDLANLADAIRDNKGPVEVIFTPQVVKEMAFVLSNEVTNNTITLTKGGNGNGRTDIATG